MTRLRSGDGHTSLIEYVKIDIGIVYGKRAANRFYNLVVNRGINPCYLLAEDYSSVGYVYSESFKQSLFQHWEGHKRRKEITVERRKHNE